MHTEVAHTAASENLLEDTWVRNKHDSTSMNTGKHYMYRQP